MMDNWCAPQWTDFTCSPQMHSDSYFEREHEEHEPQIILKSSKYQVPQIKKSELSMDSLEEDTKSMNESGETIGTPAKVAFYVPLDEEPSETNVSTIGDLPEAMKNLQICAKTRKPTLSSSTRQKSLVKKSINSTICGDFPSKYLKEKKDVKSEDGNVTLPKGISFGTTQSPKEIPSQAINKRLSYKIIRRRESNNFRSKRFSLGKNGPRVLTSQYRRGSIIKGRRRSNQFVSLAEAVSKFHSGTPERFRTVCSKALKPAALTKLKRAPLKLTCPISPALRCNQRCKQRMKNAGVLTKEQREQQELEEMKKHQIKANPVPANILKAPVPLKKVERKPNTITEEFNLTQPKTYRRTLMPLMNAKQAPIKKEDHKPITSTALTKTDTNTLSIIPEKTPTVPDKLRPIQLKQTRHTTGPLLSPSKPMEKEEHKVSSSSIATTSSTSSHSRVTRTVPFAFEARTKEYLEKREQKMKTLQNQESIKGKSEFHARPVPKFSKATSAPKEHSQKKNVVPCPFSFEERDKGLAKKKEQQVKQILEERQKPRHFHANPVPTFKPVAVHGYSKDNSRIRDKSVDRTKKSLIQPIDQENQQPNIIPIIIPDALKEDKSETKDLLCNKSISNNHKPRILESHSLKGKTAMELNTDKRAKDRQAFDEQLKQKEVEQEMKKQEEEKARIAKEKLERAELRKKAEVKARPMPLYRPLQILKSARPPTSPKSPAWASKLKCKNVP